MTPEFSRPFRIDTLGAGPRTVSIGASEEERAALALRFDLAAIEHLSAEAALVRSGETVRARGQLRAEVIQRCVATGEPVEERVEEQFDIEFRPHPESGGPDEEIELAETEMDVVFFDGGLIDLGEAVAETLSLALNPFPRAASADAVLRAAGVQSEEEARVQASPFAALAGLKDRLDR